jgi:hypothetical protein
VEISLRQNEGMSVVRWRLADYLEEYRITAYALGKASGIQRMSTVYRFAKRGEEPVRVDLVTLAHLLDGLRALTGKEVQLTDILEYDPVQTSKSAKKTASTVPLDTSPDDVQAALDHLRQLNLTEVQLAALLRQLQTQ